MTTVTCQIRVRIAWWLNPYLHTLAFICAITGMEPDMQKLERVINRAMWVVVE